MAIRSAALDDLASMADMAQDQRLRQQGWDPSFWSLSPNSRQLHPLFLRWTVDGGRSIALVATSHSSLAGYVIAGPLPSSGGPSTWAVDDIGVADPGSWRSVGAVLLAAAAGKACALGGERIVVPCPAADRTRREALVAAGLDLNSWYRHAPLDGVVESVEPMEDDEPGLPLPHLHAQAPITPGATSVTVEGGHALLSAPIPPPPWRRVGGTTAIADPVIGAGARPLWHLVRSVESTARTRGDTALTVAVGPGEEPLDALLDERGYSRPLEWWTFRATR